MLKCSYCEYILIEELAKLRLQEQLFLKCYRVFDVLIFCNCMNIGIQVLR